MIVPTLGMGLLPGYATHRRRRADPAHRAAHDPGPGGRRRIRDRQRLHDRARAAGPARAVRRDLRCGLRGRNPARLADGAGLRQPAVARRAAGVGLAHSLLAEPASSRSPASTSAARCKDLPQPAAAEQPSPLAEVLRHHLRLVLRIAGLACFAAIGFQAAFIYIADWLQRVDGVSPAAHLQGDLDQHAGGHAGVAVLRLARRPCRPAQPAAGERRARRAGRGAVLHADAAQHRRPASSSARRASCWRSASSSACRAR